MNTKSFDWFLHFYIMLPIYSIILFNKFLNIKLFSYFLFRNRFITFKKLTEQSNLAILLTYKYITPYIFLFKIVFFFYIYLTLLKTQVFLLDNIIKFQPNHTNISWWIKKENINLKSSFLMFYILLDFLKLHLKNYKLLLFFFISFNMFPLKTLPKYSYYKLFWFLILLFMYMFDTFIFYIIKHCFKKLMGQKHIWQRTDKVNIVLDSYLQFSFTNCIYYVRHYNNFLLYFRGKYKYVRLILKEIYNFVNKWWKLHLHENAFCLISKIKKNLFLGYIFIYNTFSINQTKLFLRLVMLFYFNKRTYTLSKQKHLFLKRKLYNVIKLKLLFYCLTNYYASVFQKKKCIIDKLRCLFKGHYIRIQNLTK